MGRGGKPADEKDENEAAREPGDRPVAVGGARAPDDDSEGSEFNTEEAESWTRKQSIEAGQFAVFIGGKRIPGWQLVVGAAAFLLLFVGAIVAVAAGTGDHHSINSSDAQEVKPADSDTPLTSYVTVCGKTEAEMGLDLVADYPFYQGVLPPGVELAGSAYLDDDYGVTVDGEGDAVCLGEHSAEGWAEDGDFTISFSFTKTACHIPGTYEFIFSSFGECEGGHCSISGGWGRSTPGIHVLLGCENGGPHHTGYQSSSVSTSRSGHTILRVMMTDDDGQRASFDMDVDLGNEASTKTATSWVHLALAVSRTSIKAYIDGVAVTNNHIGYALDDFFNFATHSDNLALGDPENLSRGGLGKISLTGCAYLGGSDPDQYITKGMGYSGTFAGVQLLSGMMQPEDALCLYQASTQHAGLCPAFSAIFTGAGSGRNGDTSTGLAGAEDGLAYAQRPNMMQTDEILDQSAARAMDGISEVLRGPSSTRVSDCAAICSSSGMPFMGLQHHDQCNCGQVYDKRDGMPQLSDSECDINGDGRPDCGTGLDPTEAIVVNAQACIWRNAVFDISGTVVEGSSPSSPGYIGCFADSEGNYGDDITLGGDVYVDGGYGLTFDGVGDYAILSSPSAGNYADLGEFTVAFFFTRSDCFVPGTWETLFAHQGVGQPANDLYLTTRRTADLNLRNIVEIYLGCGDQGASISDLDGTIIRTLLVDEVGTRVTFDISASAEQSGGYVTAVWAHIALSVSHSSVNAYIDGQPVSPEMLGFSPASFENDWAKTELNSAFANGPGRLTTPLAGFALSGGSEGPILGAVATSGRWTYPFAGSISFVTLWFKSLTQNEAECVYLWQSEHIDVCSDHPIGRTFSAPMTDGRTPSGAHLGGDAHMDSNGFGVTLDGLDDYMAISPAPNGYTNRGSFTISFWFTRTECTVPSGYEYLFSQRQSWAGGNGRTDHGAQIDLSVGCQANADTIGSGDASEIEGPVLRVSLRDSLDTRANFDVPLLSTELTGGAVSEMWAHLILAIDSTGATTYIDGLEVPWYRYAFRPSDRAPLDNIAFPNPTLFQDRQLAGFIMDGARPSSYGTIDTPKPGLTYLGCFAQAARGDQLFSTTVRYRRNNTLYGCSRHCNSQGFQYVGLLNANTCQCGAQPPQSVPMPDGSARLRPDFRCNKKCSDVNSRYTCGARNYNSVYRIDDIRAAAEAAPGECDFFQPISVYNGPGLSYLGCYTDHHGWRGEGGFYSEPVSPSGEIGWNGPEAELPRAGGTHNGAGGGNRDGSGGGTRNGQANGVGARQIGQSMNPQGVTSMRDNHVSPMNIQLCASLCTDYQYIALYDSSQCYCGNDPPPQSQRDTERACNDACAGDVTQLCGDGGTHRHSQVYMITGEPLAPNPCAERSPPATIVIGNQAGMTGFANSGGFAGSIAGLTLYRVSLDREEAECLYRAGTRNVAVCQKPSEMRGLHYFQSFLPAVPDLEMAMAGNDWAGRQTQAAFSSCVAACQQRHATYAALSHWVCSCGNSYGSAGAAPENLCGAEGGVPSCGTVVRDLDFSTLSGTSEPPVCVGKQAVFVVGQQLGNSVYRPLDDVHQSTASTFDDPRYLGCYRTGLFRPPGVTLHGSAFYDDDGHTSTNQEAFGWEQTFVGRPSRSGSRDFGIHFDGEGDYAEIVGENAGYSTDGSFTVSLWATRPDCHVPERAEYIFVHSKFDVPPQERGPNGEPNPGLAISYVCVENGGRTTSATLPPSPAQLNTHVHLIRFELNDDIGATAVFDVPLSSAAQGGGFVSNEWVHIAIESDMNPTNSTLSTVSVYIDGKRVSDQLLGAPPDTLSSNRAWSTAASQIDTAHMQLATLSIDTAANLPDGNGISYERCVEWGTPRSIRDYENEMVRDRLMTVQMCATLCQESSTPATHFAVGRHQACYCGSGMSRATQVDDRLCSSGCAGDGTIKCGGHMVGAGDYFSIYSFDSRTRANKAWELLPNPMNTARAIFLGGHPWPDTHGQLSGGYVGNVADLAIFDRALGTKDVDCLFRETQRTIGSCDPSNLPTVLSAYLGQSEGVPRGAAAGDEVAAPLGRQDGKVHLFPDPWLDVTRSEDDVLSGAHKVGQSLVVCSQLSSVESTRCATEIEIAAGDILVAPSPSGASVDVIPNFAADASFGLSLWFTRGWCDRVSSALETTLLSWQPTAAGSASLSIQLICASSTRAPSTLIGQHALRVEMVDDAGTAFSTDVSVDNELEAGLVEDKWASLIIGVQPNHVDIIIDSNRVQYTDARGNVTGLMGFDRSKQSERTNVAYPNPSAHSLARVFSSFETLSDAIYLGGAPNALTSDQWAGEIQQFQGFGRPLSADDVRCLYRTQLVQRD